MWHLKMYQAYMTEHWSRELLNIAKLSARVIVGHGTVTRHSYGGPWCSHMT